jgi:hypothetical protein
MSTTNSERARRARAVCILEYIHSTHIGVHVSPLLTSRTVESVSMARIASIASATAVAVPFTTSSTGGGSGVVVAAVVAVAVAVVLLLFVVLSAL